MIDYRLVYELSSHTSISSIFSGIFSSLISYGFFFLIWKITMKGEFRKLGIALTVIYLFSVLETAVKQSSRLNIEKYRVVEGEVSDWVKASYYNRRDGSFVVNGVKFEIDMHGIDSMFKTPLHFSNGRRVKVHYIKGNKIVKFYIEDYNVLLEERCNRNDYFSCFELSRRYQKKNRIKAQKYLLKSTEDNGSRYSLVVSMLYKNGILFEKNETKAEFFHQKFLEKKSANWFEEKKSIEIEPKEIKREEFDVLDMID